MKIAFNLLLVFACVLIIEAQKSKYDAVDIDTILSNQRMLDNYIKCILDKGPCTPEGKDLKEDAPKALKENCASCSPKEKQQIRKAIKHVMKNRPKDWELIKKQFDPTGQYKENFNKFINGQD